MIVPCPRARTVLSGDGQDNRRGRRSRHMAARLPRDGLGQKPPGRFDHPDVGVGRIRAHHKPRHCPIRRGPSRGTVGPDHGLLRPIAPPGEPFGQVVRVEAQAVSLLDHLGQASGGPQVGLVAEGERTPGQTGQDGLLPPPAEPGGRAGMRLGVQPLSPALGWAASRPETPGPRRRRRRRCPSASGPRRPAARPGVGGLPVRRRCPCFSCRERRAGTTGMAKNGQPEDR